jgi:hypothetical protein
MTIAMAFRERLTALLIPCQKQCQMERQLKHERLSRLIIKTLDQVRFVRIKEELGYSNFEVEVLTDLVKPKEVYLTQISQPEVIQTDQLAMTAVTPGLELDWLARKPSNRPPARITLWVEVGCQSFTLPSSMNCVCNEDCSDITVRSVLL